MTSGLYRAFAEELGIIATPLETLDVGYLPVSMKNGEPHTENAWILPERNAKGEVVGLMRRFQNGQKFCVTGSKHGLYYAFNTDSNQTVKRYNPGNHGWMRVDDRDYPSNKDGCPLCGKKKGCMVSRDDPDSPPAVMCITNKSKRQFSLGWLHILDKERNLGGFNHVMKIEDDQPILIVEGFSDTAAAMSIGLNAIGKPGNIAGNQMLKDMPLTGRAVYLIGENDAGFNKKGQRQHPGKDGMDSTYVALREMCKVTRVYPPEGVKDMREWVTGGLTREEFLTYVEEHGLVDDGVGDHILDSDQALDIASRFLKEEFNKGGSLSLRLYNKDWYEWNGKHYAWLSSDVLHGELYKFLTGKQYIHRDPNGGEKVLPYKAQRSKVGDIIATFNKWCLVTHDPPVWVPGSNGIPPNNLIMFNNGALDIDDYVNHGRVTLHLPSPELFSLTCCPYDFDPDARSEFVEDFMSETFDDSESVSLVWEWIGYMMTTDIGFEKIMLLHGAPRSGKGTILDMWAGMMGKENCSAMTLEQLTGSFGLEPLVGKLACMFGDVRNPQAKILSKALELMLQVAGGDSVPVNRKGIAISPRVQLMIRFCMAMNELPAFLDHSRAMESRLLILNFPRGHVYDSDPLIKQEVVREAETGSLINYALEGLRRLRANRKFTDPPSSKPVMDQFRTIASPVSSFTDECCVVNPHEHEELNNLFSAWCTWCKNSGRKAFQPEQFAKWLLGHVPHAEKSFKDNNHRRVTILTGVKLNEWAINNLLE
ncbi:hypothetical protein LCGC14_0343120 [marine sediment metagenome]|uniref:SF3 helicase domain-containing protein n=1 Tax=marine sediment metagenome TaxID=412755 RepID=A0A0F9TIN6_9ZZZZ